MVPRAYIREIMVQIGKIKEEDNRDNLLVVEMVNRALDVMPTQRGDRAVTAR